MDQNMNHQLSDQQAQQTHQSLGKGQKNTNNNEASGDPQMTDADQNYQFYKEYCRLYYANIILTNRLQQLLNEKKDLQFKLNRLETNKRAHEDALGMTFDIADEKRKRHRRTATEISRHYPCPIDDCPKSYGSEGSLNQHLKLKHPEFYKQQQIQANQQATNFTHLQQLAAAQSQSTSQQQGNQQHNGNRNSSFSDASSLLKHEDNSEDESNLKQGAHKNNQSKSKKKNQTHIDQINDEDSDGIIMESSEAEEEDNGSDDEQHLEEAKELSAHHAVKDSNRNEKKAKQQVNNNKNATIVKK